MAKFIEVTPRRLQQLVQEGVVPKSEGRGRYNPIAVNLAYIRYLRDRVQSPELSVDEFFTAKLAKIKSEREMVELEMSIKRRERVPIDVVTAVNNEVAMAIAGILRANVDKVLTRNLINEIFEQFSDTPESLRWNLPADPLTIQVFRDPEYGRPIGYPRNRGKLIGYVVTRQFAVKVRDVTAFPKLVDDLIAAANVGFTEIEGSFSKGEDVSNELWDKALADARKQAEKTVKQMGMKIDSVFAISPFQLLKSNRPCFLRAQRG
jgi:hypothetical protein